MEETLQPALLLLIVSRCFKKIPATSCRNQFKHMPSFPESFGRVLALLGLFVCLVNIRKMPWYLERLRRGDQPMAE